MTDSSHIDVYHVPMYGTECMVIINSAVYITASLH